MNTKVEKRFAKAVRSSGLVTESDMRRAIDLQKHGALQGRAIPLDRILLKLNLLDRDQILGLWHALRYYVWRKEDKLYVKIAVQSKLLSEETGRLCLREQKQSYKHEDELVRVNEIARQRGYLKGSEDRAIVEAMHRIKPELTISPVGDDDAGETFERPSVGSARIGDGSSWKNKARRNDLDDLKQHFDTSGEIRGVSDEDLDALWEEADLDDVELDSQAIEIAQAPLFDSEDDLDELDDLDLDDLFD